MWNARASLIRDDSRIEVFEVQMGSMTNGSGKLTAKEVAVAV